MKNTIIFCEGITDQIFIADCLELFFGMHISRKKYKDATKIDIKFGESGRIIAVDGCDKLKVDIYLDMLKDNSEENGSNIVIFDADYSVNDVFAGSGNNGFKSASQKLNEIKKTHSVDFEFYLWHNHQDDGEVEDLILQLIPENKRMIFDCINAHQNCLSQTGVSRLRIADIKMQLNYYLHTLNEDSRLINRDYKNSEYWNLDCNQIRDLNSLKVFLTRSCGFDDI